MDVDMKLSIVLSALVIIGFTAASTEKASAIIYCQYIERPAGCIARPGVTIAPPGVFEIPHNQLTPSRGALF